MLFAREVMPGTITISMEVGGPVRLSISSKPEGSSDKRSAAELNRLGLEHFGFNVTDLDAELGSPVLLDEGNDDYFMHEIPGCPDVADSPYLAPAR